MRARHQNGWVEETSARTWKAHWYEYVRDPETGTEQRRHHSRVLGEKSKMRKFEAESELLKIVSPLNATRSLRRDDRVSLRGSWSTDGFPRWKAVGLQLLGGPMRILSV